MRFEGKVKALFHQTKEWQRRRTDGTLYLSSARLKKDYGNDYRRLVDALVDRHGLTMVKEHVAPTFAYGRKIGRGESAVYSYDQSKALDLVVEEDVTPLLANWLEDRTRTNLDSLTPNAFITEGVRGDSRTYTDFTQLPKTKLSEVTIDGEPLREYDIRNAFPLFLGLSYRHTEPEYLELVRRGELYDFFASLENVDRSVAKLAIHKGLNSPYAVRFNHLYMRMTDEERAMSRIWKKFCRAFPKFSKWVRSMAKEKGLTYRIGAKVEKTIRDKMMDKARISGIFTLQRHDAIFVKESDAVEFEVIFKQTLISFSHSHRSSIDCPVFKERTESDEVFDLFFSYPAITGPPNGT